MTMSVGLDPTFYRSAREAAAAPVESLAYVVAFDRTGQVPDALTVVDLDEAPRTATGRSWAGRTCPTEATRCTISAGTPAAAP